MLTALAMLPLGTMVTRLSPVMTISSSSESDSEIIRLEVCASDGRGHKLKPFSNKKHISLRTSQLKVRVVLPQPRVLGPP